MINLKTFLSLFKKQKKKEKENTHPITQEIIKKIPIIAQVKVKNIMIPRTDVISIPINISFNDLFYILKKHPHSRIPIYEKSLDDIIGIFYPKDLLYLLYEFLLKKETKPISFQEELKNLMRPPLFIPESTNALSLLRDFQRSRSHIAIVVDEYGGFSGIISLEDILEEIVGDIYDEYDPQELPSIYKITPNSYIVDSKTYIQKINETLNLDLPMNSVDTIGGFIFELFGYLPKKNDKIDYKNLRFKILQIQKNRIKQIAIYISAEKKNIKSNKLSKKELL